jgi:hypothetical protein
MVLLSVAEPARRILRVEGKDDSAIVRSLCARHRITPVFPVQERGGVEEIVKGLAVDLRAPDLARYGVVLDANGDPGARWAAIRRILQEAGYTDVPVELQAEGAIVNPPPARPRFGAWIMPNNESTGAVEDFAAALVPTGDRLWERAVAAVDGIPSGERRFPEVRRRKAEVHTWLAWQEYPGSPMGQAIGKGDLDGNAPIAVRFVDWLRRLMLDDDGPAERP